MLRRQDLAYLAGYFDADGCVAVSLNGSTLSVKVSISGRNESLCGRLEVIFGGGIDNAPSGTSTWYAYSNTAHDFLYNIAPHVQYKKDQVELALAVLNPKTAPLKRLKAALAICHLNQQNLAEPQFTKTMTRISDAIMAIEGKEAGRTT